MDFSKSSNQKYSNPPVQHDHFHNLMHSLGASLGLKTLTPDTQGYCCLQIGERITVSIQYDVEYQDLVMFSRICQLDSNASAEAYELLLNANLLWFQTERATLALDRYDAGVFLQMKEKIEAIDFSRFLSMLEKFVETGEAWQDRLDRFTANKAWPTPKQIITNNMIVLS
jgi:hypothetical protein